LQLRVKDRSGNIGISETIVLRVDTVSPSLTISSPTHPDQKLWYSNNQPIFTWVMEQNISRIRAYSWRLDQNPNTVPPETIMLKGEEHQFNPRANGFDNFADGTWYFHLRACSGANSWGETQHYHINIDTTPPRAWVRYKEEENIAGVQVKQTGNSDGVRGDNAYFGAGRFYLQLTLSEVLPKGAPPKLYYQPYGKRRIELGGDRGPPLQGSDLNWSAFVDVDMHTGDGWGELLFEAVDRAGNVGTDIAEGKFFCVDTRLRKDATETQYVFDAPNESVISIPPGALQQDIRMEISRFIEEEKKRTIYILRAFDANYQELPDITFLKPVDISLGYPLVTSANTTKGQTLAIFYDDGRRIHQIGGTVEKGKIVRAKVNHPGKFVIVMSEPITKLISKGYAAPNPFAPSRSKTFFHVVTLDNNVQFTIKIFDLTGRLVKTLKDGNKVWDGKDEHGRIVEGGVYIYQIKAGDDVISGTVVVVK